MFSALFHTCAQEMRPGQGSNQSKENIWQCLTLCGRHCPTQVAKATLGTAASKRGRLGGPGIKSLYRQNKFHPVSSTHFSTLSPKKFPSSDLRAEPIPWSEPNAFLTGKPSRVQKAVGLCWQETETRERGPGKSANHERTGVLWGKRRQNLGSAANVYPECFRNGRKGVSLSCERGRLQCLGKPAD